MCEKRTNFTGMVASMTHGRTTTKTMPLLIGAGLFLSACAASTEYGPSPYATNEPIYGTLDFDYGDWGGGGSYNGWRGRGGPRFGGEPPHGWVVGGEGGGGPGGPGAGGAPDPGRGAPAGAR